MNVLALTIFVGTILVTLFVLLWLLQVMSPHGFSERNALLPLGWVFQTALAYGASSKAVMCASSLTKIWPLP